MSARLSEASHQRPTFGRASRLSRLVTMGMVVSVLLGAAGCAGEEDEIGAEEAHSTAATFDRHLVLSDESLTDGSAMTLAEVEAFLANTPHGKRSGLADVSSNGRSAAQAYVDAGQQYGINPLVLLTRSQLEQGLVSKTSIKQSQLDWAMGCGCPDGKACIERFRGFDKQIECAAERLRTYLNEMDEKGTSIAGWGVGITKTTLDGFKVTPRNRATAAIFTYTPWASSAKNHASIWRKYAAFTDYVSPAPGGCDVVTFESGMRVQLRPSSLGAQYDESQGPVCFLDATQLVDPFEHTVWDTSGKVSNNFRLSEYVTRSSDQHILLHPALVEVVQAVRNDLARGVSIKKAYQSPDAFAASCGDACDTTGELTQGYGVVIGSSAGNGAIMQAAAAAGAPTCFEHEGAVFVGIGSDEQGCPR